VRHAETSPPWGREEGIAIEKDCTAFVAIKPLPAVSPAALSAKYLHICRKSAAWIAEWST
jgi:hypothetical protein